MAEDNDTGEGSNKIPLVYARGIMDTPAPVSMIKLNFVAPSLAATSKSGGFAGATASTRPSSFPKE